MRLDDELKAIGCNLDCAEFVDRLADLFAATNRDRSVDDLRCDWRDAKKFCQDVRARLKLADTADELILRTLDNHRRGGDLNVGEVRSRSNLRTKLQEIGFPGEPDDFRDEIAESFVAFVSGWSVDQLLNRWADAGYFCGIVRQLLGIKESPAADSVILSTMLAMRKQGRLSLRDRVGTQG